MKNKLWQLALALLMIPCVVTLVRSNSGTQYSGTTTQPVSGTVSVNALPTGTNNIGTVNGSTVTVVGVGGAAIGVSFSGGLAAGTNNIGTVNGSTVTVVGVGGANVKVDIQNTPAVTATLAAETTKVIGTINVAAAQTIATTNAGTFAVQAAQSGTWTVQPGNTANTTAWLVTSPAASAPTVTKVGATTTSAQLIAANGTRKGIEVDCDCANTDNVAINFGASAAVYANHKILIPCSNYAPPPGVVVTSAIQIISNTGTQNCRVIEYP